LWRKNTIEKKNQQHRNQKQKYRKKKNIDFTINVCDVICEKTHEWSKDRVSVKKG